MTNLNLLKRKRDRLLKNVNKFVFFLPLIELFCAVLPYDYAELAIPFSQIELVIAFLLAPYIKKELSFVLFLYFLWIFISDRLFVYPQYLAVIEVAILTSWLVWLVKRPEKIPSDPPSNTVQIAFYHGIKAPLIAKLASLFNLPFYGIAVVIEDNVMMPRRKSRCVKKTSRDMLSSWTILDTKIQVNNDILSAFNLLEGKHIDDADCMSVMDGLLDKLGTEYKSTSDPSSYMTKILDLRV